MNTSYISFIIFILLYCRSTFFKNKNFVVTASQLTKECFNCDVVKKNIAFPPLRRCVCLNNLFEKDNENKDEFNSLNLKCDKRENFDFKNNPNISNPDFICDMQVLFQKFSYYSMESVIDGNYIKNLNKNTFCFIYDLHTIFKSRAFKNVNEIVKKITILNSFNFLENINNLEKENKIDILKSIPPKMRNIDKNEFDEIYRSLIMLKNRMHVEVCLFNNNSFYLSETASYILEVFDFSKQYFLEINSLSSKDNFLNMCSELLELTFKNLSEIFSKDSKDNIKLNKNICDFLNKEINAINMLAKEELRNIDSKLEDLYKSHSLNRENFDLFFSSYIIRKLKDLKNKSLKINSYQNLQQLFTPFTDMNEALLKYYKTKLQYLNVMHKEKNEAALKKYLEGEMTPAEMILINEAFQSYKKYILLKKKLFYLIDIMKLNYNNKKFIRHAYSIGKEYANSNIFKEKIDENLKNIDEKLKIIQGKKSIANIFIRNVEQCRLLIEELNKTGYFLKITEKYVDALISSSTHIKENSDNNRETNLILKLLKKKKKVMLDNNFMSAYSFLFFYNYISFITL
ncbi:hypothetical protein PGAL8A_00478100 [Plasmodium gallinaceum]|uniref:Reticulocyte binding protein n=1 Tax=Plasmodium gallinaceum TaxID=5849 RepID=A0A1J1H0Z0_PLAGA|nr:hypothetical protein PGAL8A_00478100 [Plasmodium gallinaceum]CRG97202.1 hypothetical protein PGAL8A_00478100 [Plasmodium gallinaceum]